MNVLKAIFNSSTEETDFFATTHPLANTFWNADHGEPPLPSDTLAVVKTEITPGQLGRVTFRGVRWRACCDRAFSIPLETQVRVLGRRANILVVEPMGRAV
jgi:hypothetical protein